MFLSSPAHPLQITLSREVRCMKQELQIVKWTQSEDRICSACQQEQPNHQLTLSESSIGGTRAARARGRDKRKLKEMQLPAFPGGWVEERLAFING